MPLDSSLLPRRGEGHTTWARNPHTVIWHSVLRVPHLCPRLEHPQVYSSLRILLSKPFEPKHCMYTGHRQAHTGTPSAAIEHVRIAEASAFRAGHNCDARA